MTLRIPTAGLLLLVAGVAAGAAGTWYYFGPAKPAGAAARGANGGSQRAVPADAPAQQRAADTPAGEPGLTLPAAAVTRAGIGTAALAATTRQPEFTAFGYLEPDPGATALVRAPVAGVVRRAAGKPWPVLGARLAAGTTMGVLAPRLTPIEQEDLEAKARQANLDTATAKIALETADKALKRARTLNADGKNVADRTVEEAAARVATETARRDAAAANERRLRQLLEAGADAVGLVAPIAGEVVDVFVLPGQAVEAGAALLRVTDRGRLLARVAVPIGEAPDPGATAVRIGFLRTGSSGAGSSGTVPSGTVPSGTGSSGTGSSGAVPSGPQRVVRPGKLVTFTDKGDALLAVEAGDAALRSGLPVTAWLPRKAAPVAGILVPRGGIVRLRGRTMVFIRRGGAEPGSTKPVRFVLREVPVDRPTAAGFFVPLKTAGGEAAGSVRPRWAAGEQVVVRGAGTLLSHLLRAEIPEAEPVEDAGK